VQNKDQYAADLNQSST